MFSQVQSLHLDLVYFWEVEINPRKTMTTHLSSKFSQCPHLLADGSWECCPHLKTQSLWLDKTGILRLTRQLNELIWIRHSEQTIQSAQQKPALGMLEQRCTVCGLGTAVWAEPENFSEAPFLRYLPPTQIQTSWMRHDETGPWNS